MKAIILAILLLIPYVTHASQSDFYTLYNQLLETYWRPTVTINGISTTVLDYQSMKNDAEEPQSLLMKVTSAIEEVDITTFKNKN